MNTQSNIKFIQQFNTKYLSLLGKETQENYQLLKEDTENFRDFSVFEAVPDAEKTLNAWVISVNEKLKDLPIEVPVSKTTKTSEDKNLKARPPKAINAKINEQKIQLKKELMMMVAKVKENAKFKEKVAKELQQYLKQVNIGLGAIKDEEFIKLKAKHKFYKNLLAGDTADFKAIAKRVGLTYSHTKPRAKQNQAGLGAKKSIGEHIKDFFTL